MTEGGPAATGRSRAVPSPLSPSAATSARSQGGTGEVIDGRFVVQRQLGEGGMGRVYHVQDLKIEGRDVALKMLLPRFSQREGFRDLFIGEVRSAQEFVSEFVCQIRDVGETATGALYLTMDLVEGESLRGLLDREKVLAPRHALEIARQVLLGLAGGHEKGFIHRDIKPSNVMLTARVPRTDSNPYGVGVRLLDFGIAGLAAEVRGTSRAGTIHYMSPEQARGEALDARSDLFAVGVLVFEMLSGRRPFEGATTDALVQSVIETDLRGRLDEIPNLPKPLRELLERALQKDRARRFQSANEFADAVARCSAWRVKAKTPAWAIAAVALFGAVAAAEGILWANASRHAEDLDRQLGGARVDFVAEVAAAVRVKEQRIGELESELRKANEAGAAAIGRANDAEQALKDLQQARKDTAQDKSTETISERQWDEQEEALGAAREAVSRLEGDKRKLQELLDAANGELALLKDASSPEGKYARVFDAALAALNKRAGDIALQQVTAARTTLGAFPNADLDGAPFLIALCEAASALDSRPFDSAARDRARDSLARARQASKTFGDDARSWIGHGMDGRDAAPRLEAAADALALIESAFEESGKRLEDEDSRAWSAIGASAAPPSPSDVFAHVEKYACRHWSDALDDVLESSQAAVGDGGEVDFSALAPADAWLKALGERSLGGGDARLGELRLLDIARRWYDRDGQNDPRDLAEWPAVELPDVGDRSSDWRHVLRLEVELHLASQRGTGRRYYRVQSQGVRSWFLDVLDDANVRRSQFDAAGKGNNTPATTFDVNVNIRGDLRARGAGVRVERFPALSDEPPPDRLLEASKWNAFRAAVSESGPCLVIESDGATRWYSPRYGLVREQSSKLLMELACAD